MKALLYWLEQKVIISRTIGWGYNQVYPFFCLNGQHSTNHILIYWTLCSFSIQFLQFYSNINIHLGRTHKDSAGIFAVGFLQPWYRKSYMSTLFFYSQFGMVLAETKFYTRVYIQASIFCAHALGGSVTDECHLHSI